MMVASAASILASHPTVSFAKVNDGVLTYVWPKEKSKDPTNKCAAEGIPSKSRYAGIRFGDVGEHQHVRCERSHWPLARSKANMPCEVHVVHCLGLRLRVLVPSSRARKGGRDGAALPGLVSP